MANAPSSSEAASAARAFLRFRDEGNSWTQADLLMRLGRLYEFPPGTPHYTGPWQAANIAGFIQTFAREIE